MAKLRYEDFIDLIFNLDILGNNIDKDFKTLIFDNKNKSNLELICDYFFDTTYIKELRSKILDDDILEGEKLEKFIEQLIVMYPLSKKLLENIIYNINMDVEKKLLKKLMYRNNVFVNGIESYIDSIDRCFKEEKEEIQDLKETLQRIKEESTRIENLKKQKEEKEQKNEELKTKIKEREKLEKEIRDLENLSSGEYDKKNEELEKKIKNLERDIKKKKAEQEEKNKKILNLKKHLESLEKNKDNEEEDKLIAQLIKLWGDND